MYKFILRVLCKYFNTYTHGEMGECFKETNSGVYL